MGKRRFGIFEAKPGSTLQHTVVTITERELKRRMFYIRVNGPMTWEQERDILLHGTEKKLCGCGKPLGHQEPCPPYPEEQTDVWEATIKLLHRMLNASIFGWPEGELEKVHQLLDELSTMPRKEQP